MGVKLPTGVFISHIMNRRGIGVAGLQRQAEARAQFRDAGQQLAANATEKLQEQLESFKRHLETFAAQHSKAIRRDVRFRQQFQQLCSQIGVDPLASNKGFWADLLGVGDIYYELAVQCVDVCMSARLRTGGLVDLAHVVDSVRKKRGRQAQEVTEEDIIRALKTLKPLGAGYSIIQVGDKKLVQAQPTALSQDEITVLAEAQRTGGHFSKTSLSTMLAWTNERIERIIDAMMLDGSLWIDQQVEPFEYWVASYVA